METPNKGARPSLRSRDWWDNPDNPGMTALYLERYLNNGLTLEELRSGKPIVGIAQTGSDLSPCNWHHLNLAQRVRAGIRDAGGIPLESPSIRSRRRDDVPPLPLIATSPILGWWRSFMAILSTGSY